MKKDRMFLRQLAKARANGKEHWGRDFNSDAFFIGLVGEDEFAHQFWNWGVSVDERILEGGDSGIDSKIGPYTIDVKTYDKAYNLFRETDRTCHADILVLAQYHAATETATLLGWEWAIGMLRCPQKRFYNGAPINYYKHNSKLRPMSELKTFLKIFIPALDKTPDPVVR